MDPSLAGNNNLFINSVASQQPEESEQLVNSVASQQLVKPDKSQQLVKLEQSYQSNSKCVQEIIVPSQGAAGYAAQEAAKQSSNSVVQSVDSGDLP